MTDRRHDEKQAFCTRDGRFALLEELAAGKTPQPRKVETEQRPESDDRTLRD